MRAKRVSTIFLAMMMAFSVFVVPYGSAYAENTEIDQPTEVFASNDLGNAVVLVEDQIYDGSAKTPEVKVTLNGVTLDESDYTVEYDKNVYPGKAKVTVEATGDEYIGSATETFDISPLGVGNVTKVSSEVTTEPSANKTKSVSNEKAYADTTFSWDAVSGSGISYNYTVTTTGGSVVKSGTFGADKEVTGLYAGQDYYITVEAADYNGRVIAKSTPYIFTTARKSVSKKISKGYYYYYYINGNFVGTDKAMWDKVKNSSSSGKYLIAVNRARNNVVIYQGKKGNWKPIKHWLCCCGKAGHRTPKGSMKILSKKWGFSGVDNPRKHTFYTVWHATRFKKACFFHSVIYKYKSKSRTIDTSLGDCRSHGCIRLDKSNAYWIKKYAKIGTRVIIYSYN